MFRNEYLNSNEQYHLILSAQSFGINKAWISRFVYPFYLHANDFEWSYKKCLRDLLSSALKISLV